MVDVFMGDKHPVQIFGTEPQLLHSLHDTAAGYARVYQHHSGFAAHHGRIAFAAAGQYCHLETAHARASSSASLTPALQPNRSAPAFSMAFAVA